MLSPIHILISALLVFLLGWLWHGPLFGKKWCAVQGLPQPDKKNCCGKDMAMPMVITILSWALTAAVFGWLLPLMPAADAHPAFCLAILIWLGFKLPEPVSQVIWKKKPMDLLWLEGGFTLAALLIIAAVYTFV